MTALISLTSFDQKGELKVDAHTNHAKVIRNDTNKELRISFIVTGTWCMYKNPTSDPALSAFNAQTDWKGYSKLPKDIYDKYPWRLKGATAGALLVYFSFGGSSRDGKVLPDSIALPPGHSAVFVPNSIMSGDLLFQSQGQLTIKFSCSLKDSPAAAPSPQPAAPIPAKEPSANPVSVNPIKEPAATRTGKLLVLHDEYMLSDTGFQKAPDTEIFVKNMAKYLTNNKGGVFLDHSTYYMTNPDVVGTALEKALSSPPYSYIRDSNVSLNQNNFRAYAAMIVGGLDINGPLLIDYIKSGGSVCLIAGTGYDGSAATESAQWSQLLNTFGLQLEPAYNDVTGVVPVTSPDHPLFAGVKGLFQYWGQTVRLLPNSKASIIMESNSHGLIGLAEVPVTQ